MSFKPSCFSSNSSKSNFKGFDICCSMLNIIYFKYIKKQNPYSLVAVEDLLSKFKKNIKLIEGDTNKIFHNIDLKNIDFIFIDGGHDYKTVKNDLEQSYKIINKTGTILCDDWNLSQALGVREAIKDFSKERGINFEIVYERFAQFNIP